MAIRQPDKFCGIDSDSVVMILGCHVIISQDTWSKAHNTY